MKYIIIFLMSFSSLVYAQDTQYMNLKGEYLGQTPPGDIPVVFAPGIVSTDGREFMISFSADKKMCVFSRAVDNGIDKSEMNYSINTNNGWTVPASIPFIKNNNDRYFILDSRKHRLYFSSSRPLPGTTEELEKIKLWGMDYSNNQWKIPEIVDVLVNTDNVIGHPSFTDDGTIYFYDESEAYGLDKADLFFIRKKNGKYGKIQNPGPAVNTDYDECDAFIDPQEKYMIYAVEYHPDCIGDFDIFISFKDKNGNWTKGISMGDKLNSSGREIYPRVSPDGKYIFFASNKSGNWEIYWMNAGIIEKLRKDTK